MFCHRGVSVALQEAAQHDDSVIVVPSRYSPLADGFMVVTSVAVRDSGLRLIVLLGSIDTCAVLAKDPAALRAKPLRLPWPLNNAARTEVSFFVGGWMGQSWQQLRSDFEGDGTQPLARYWTKKRIYGKSTLTFGCFVYPRPVTDLATSLVQWVSDTPEDQSCMCGFRPRLAPTRLTSKPFASGAFAQVE